MKGADHPAEILERSKASMRAGQLEKFHVCQAGTHNVKTETQRLEGVAMCC